MYFKIYICSSGYIRSQLQQVESWLQLVASFPVVHGFPGCGTWASLPLACEDPSSWLGLNPWPCIEWILSLWTTREVLKMAFFYQSSVGISLSFSYNSSCLWLHNHPSQGPQACSYNGPHYY